MEITELKTTDLYELCNHSRKLSLADNENDSGNASYDDKCSKWLRTTSFSDCESVCSSEISDATKSSEDSEEYAEEYSTGNKEIRLFGDAYHENQTELLFRSSVNTYRNVTINKSKNVHLGNITYINGPVYHVESRKWDDIGYNFLIGCDGNVYEGRGWTAIGAHTYNFNKYSVGIAFVGCFINKTPPKAALANAKQLIAYGVKIGAIDEDYQLLAHCQCVTTASPGMMLYEEIKTWKNWAGDVNVDNPPIEVLNDRNLC
ncbi:N-acetylmuramoyl-L-alanine amidase [Popillia japonica]|uniref:N-acetylmuramoyl-L-alanine amidase n=1 Tax=Popillia japonica TaxID=7064 RepID=A0AAW1KHZ3_POPJA